MDCEDHQKLCDDVVKRITELTGIDVEHMAQQFPISLTFAKIVLELPGDDVIQLVKERMKIPLYEFFGDMDPQYPKLRKLLWKYNLVLVYNKRSIVDI